MHLPEGGAIQSLPREKVAPPDLGEASIASVLTNERASFGNNLDPVTIQDVRSAGAAH